MKTEQMIAKLNAAYDDVKECGGYVAMTAVQEVRDALMERLREESAKTAGILTKVKILNRICREEKRLIGAWMGKDGCQYMGNAFTLFKFYAPVPGVVERADRFPDELESLYKLFEMDNSHYVEIDADEIDLAKLKACIKAAKAENKRKNPAIRIGCPAIRIGCQYFNALYIADMLTVMQGNGCKIYQYADDSVIYPKLYMMNEKGEAVIMPLRIANEHEMEASVMWKLVYELDVLTAKTETLA